MKNTIARTDKKQTKSSASQPAGRQEIRRKSAGIQGFAGRYRRFFTCSSSYGGFFSIFSYACASQFYDAFFFYHKA
jgi:hypothetical protein